MKANRLFFLLMAGSSALGLARAFVLAGLLTTEDFGRYAILMAIALFLSPLAGLGLIEETRKLFPRFFVDGRSAEIVGRADHVTRLVGLRIAALGAIATIALAVAGWFWWASVSAAMTLIAFGNAWSSIMASALRAGTTTLPLGVTSLLRASITLPLTVFAAVHFGLIGALWGEAIGAICGGAIMRAALRRPSADASPAGAESHSSRASHAGMLVFLGSALVSAPFYLNRPVAALALSAAEVGTLSFLLVLVGALQTTIAICDQVVGPRLVHWQHGGMNLARQKRRFFLIVTALAAISLAAFVAMWIGMHVPLIAPMIDKYALTESVIVPAAVLAALNITSTADWMLQAHDRERIITIAAAGNLTAFGVLTILIIAGTVEMEAYIWGLAGAKLCQLIVQLAAINTLTDR
ncbi:hypothetical protein [Sphingopyxis sp.]|uniref:hypothetical protein n=1 Tax=Sphingopyxis sp. TaxID=1908224 RepID=UPI002FCBC3C9